jgi:hypothetical protein
LINGLIKANSILSLIESIEKILVYHGTDNDFDQFDYNKIGSTTDDGMLGKGFYFSTDKNIARSNKIRIAVELTIKNPLLLYAHEWTINKKKLITEKIGISLNSTSSKITKVLKDKGYDSVILNYKHLHYFHKEIVVFDLKQIKVKSKDLL